MTSSLPPQDVIFCHQCGAQWGADALYCRHCGAQLLWPGVNNKQAPKKKETVVAPPTKPELPVTTQTTTQPKKPLVLDNQKVQYQPATGFSRLGRDMQTGDYVDVPQASRRQGLYIIGANGTGKTGLIENLILQDINQGLGVGLLDPHGDLTNTILAKMTKRIEDVILLDLADYNFPFGLNLFTCSDPTDLQIVSEAANKVMHIFKKLWGKSGIVVEDAWGVLLEEILRAATMTFLEYSQYEVYTMAEIPLLLENAAFRNHLVQKLHNRHVKNYWLNKYNRLSDKDQLEERRSTLNRVNAFLTQPLVEHIVGQTTTTVDFRQVMDERKIVLVKLNNRMEDVTSLIGSMIIAEMLDAAYSRAALPVNKRKQFNLYADEFQRFATEDFATLLTEARKFGIATTIAHQARYQPGMTDGIRAVSLQAANLVVFRVTSLDADELAGEFDITPQEAWEEELEEEWVEVLKEEWHERVEETITDGEEESKTPIRDVLTHIKQQGHADKRVARFVTEFVHKLYQASEEPLDHTHSRRDWPMPPEKPTVTFGHSGFKLPTLEYGFLPQDVKKTLPTLNHLLYLWNSWRFPGSSKGGWSWIQEYTAVEQEVYKGFADLLGYPHYYKAHFEPETAEGKNALARLQTLRKAHYDVVSAFEQLGEVEYERQMDDIEKQQKQYEAILDQECIRIITDILRQQAALREHGAYHFEFEEGWFAVNSHRNFFFPYKINEKDLDLHTDYIFGEEKQRFHSFMYGLQAVCQGISKTPILAGSGHYQPRTRTQVTYLTHPRETITHPRVAITHPQRTFQDVKNDIANQLSSLPNFTARTRITVEEQTVEYTVKTLAPGQGIGNELQQRIATIQTQNRQTDQLGRIYCRSRQEVEKEITKRQAGWDGSPASLPQPQPAQRHARQVPVQEKCSTCGFSHNLPGTKFCSNCGTQL